MEGASSPGRRGRRCQSSSLMKGINGWIMVKPPSRAVYRVCFADSCSVGLPPWIIVLEFSM